jgi:hypothetical protein
MNPCYISSWHLTTLITNLNLLLDTAFTVVPLVNNAGIKVFSQWHASTAKFEFRDKDTVVVTLDEKWSEVNRSALITAISRTFHWEHMPRGVPWCCSLLTWHNRRQLVFSL